MKSRIILTNRSPQNRIEFLKENIHTRVKKEEKNDLLSNEDFRTKETKAIMASRTLNYAWFIAELYGRKQSGKTDEKL